MLEVHREKANDLASQKKLRKKRACGRRLYHTVERAGEIVGREGG
jgi:hypothetical protein